MVPRALPVPHASCMRELLRAVVTHKPIIALLELEVKLGGLAREEVLQRLRAADESCQSDAGVHHASWYHMCGLDGDVAGWGCLMPSADELIMALFHDDPLEWNRIGSFQDVRTDPQR